MADAWHCKQIPNGSNPLVVCEREALQAEIERLRAAGDALAAVLRSGSDTGWDAAIDQWQEVCRG